MRKHIDEAFSNYSRRHLTAWSKIISYITPSTVILWAKEDRLRGVNGSYFADQSEWNLHRKNIVDKFMTNVLQCVAKKEMVRKVVAAYASTAKAWRYKVVSKEQRKWEWKKSGSLCWPDEKKENEYTSCFGWTSVCLFSKLFFFLKKSRTTFSFTGFDILPGVPTVLLECVER